MQASVLREYQRRATRRVHEEWRGHRAVCCVAPCGAGKTTLGAALVAPFASAVWVAPRIELIKQAADRLRGDGLRVGMLAPDLAADPSAPIQVGTIQTLLARNIRPPAELVALDEAHHFGKSAEHWSAFVEAYPDAKWLGLTATPARKDGSPLGDVFDSLVEVASYSELIAQGFLVDCTVYAAPPDQAMAGLSKHPLDAYREYGEDSRAFMFCDRVARAEKFAVEFSEAGIRSAVIHGKTPAAERAWALKAFADGAVRVLMNVGIFLEGTDIPAARTIILAKRITHESQLLQIGGRVLRPHSEKPYAIFIDLVDATAVHGLPTEDRVYSLDGTPIRRSAEVATSKCLNCSAIYSAASARCPRCGFLRPKRPLPPVRIYDRVLERVYAGKDTPADAKQREFDRLRRVADGKGWSVGWAMEQYEKLFAERPHLELDEAGRRRELEKLRLFAGERGFQSGWVAHRYKDVFGDWPPRSWPRDPILPGLEPPPDDAYGGMPGDASP